MIEYDYPPKGLVKGEYRRFRRGHNMQGVKGAAHPGFKGARTFVCAPDGYAFRRIPDHPRAKGKNKSVREHILVVEAALGHALRPTACVHHVDGCKSNNANRNLVACDSLAYHNLLHQRTRALTACGHADWRKCRFCKQHDDPSNLYIKRSGKSVSVFHRACSALDKRQRAHAAAGK